MLVIAWLAGGCCTYSVWNDDDFDCSNLPAQDPGLRLYQAKLRHDYLAVYREYSERNRSIRTRAYWVNENRDRVNHSQAPQFVNAKAARHLPAIPVYDTPPAGTIAPPPLFAICSTNRQSFALYDAEGVATGYRFPFYDDGWGTVEKTALTPLAVMADAAIVAGAVAILAAGSYEADRCEYR